MDERMTRRRLLAAGAGAGAMLSGAVGRSWAAPGTDARPPTTSAPRFPISLNTSTLRGYKLPITQAIDIAAQAGYQGIEPWSDELDRYVESGGSLKDLRQRLVDRGLAVTGAIAFYEWMVDDDERRARGFREARRRMDQLARIGATHVAAAPCGDVAGVDLLKAAERYRQLLELSEPIGVTPAVEIWGGARNCCRLGQAALIAVEAQHPKACVLPDVFHLYKGGSGLTGIRHLNGRLLAGFHLNDYAADPPRETIADKHRLYPGDGIAPLADLVRDLRDIGYPGPLSVELFNPTYWQQDPLVVARTALEKTRDLIQAAFISA